MTHLSEPEFADAAEDALDAARSAHLETCAACRDQAESVRAARRSATSVTIPEPSPLFWDHLSARIREDIAAEPQVRRIGRRPRLLAALGCAAAILVAVGISVRERPQQTISPQAVRNAAPVSPSSAPIVSPSTEAPATDAAWALLRDAASDMQFDDAAEAGLNVRPGAVDSAVLDLTPAERDALGRLLQDAIKSRSAPGKTL
jgi:hypothetical protein